MFFLLCLISLLKAGAVTDSATITTLLSIHNNARSAVCELPVVWDASLAQVAGTFIDTCPNADYRGGWSGINSSSCYNRTFQGPPYSYYCGVGSNWAGASGGYNATTLAPLWVNERNCYTCSSGACNTTCYQQMHSDGCGHYTQVIWQGTTTIGCGFASHCSYIQLVCFYYPEGNFNSLHPIQSAPSSCSGCIPTHSPTHAPTTTTTRHPTHAPTHLPTSSCTAPHACGNATIASYFSAHEAALIAYWNCIIAHNTSHCVNGHCIAISQLTVVDQGAQVVIHGAFTYPTSLTFGTAAQVICTEVGTTLVSWCTYSGQNSRSCSFGSGKRSYDGFDFSIILE